jgi:excisionase family DNA binding protein
VFEDEMLTIDDLAAYLKLKPQTIYRWAQSGKLPGAKFGKEWRFRRSTIERWIDEQMGSAEGNSEEATPGRGTRAAKLHKTNSESDVLETDEKQGPRRAGRGRKAGMAPEAN